MLVRVPGLSVEAAHRVRQTIPHFDVITWRVPAYVEALVHPKDLPTLRGLGLQPTVLHDDVEAFWASQLAPPGVAPTNRGGFSRGSMGGFLTLAEITACSTRGGSSIPT